MALLLYSEIYNGMCMTSPASIPALPPKTGCRVCGRRGWSMCPQHALETDQSPRIERLDNCAGCGVTLTRQNRCSATGCLACEQAKVGKATGDYGVGDWSNDNIRSKRK